MMGKAPFSNGHTQRTLTPYESMVRALSERLVEAQRPIRILERQPQLREAFRLGNRLVWVTPSGTALVVDPGDGREEMSDADIDALFVAVK